MSFPLFNEELTFTQPDGTTFKVRAWGDQHHASFRTLDGHAVVRDPTSGYYHYATTTPEHDELRSTPARVGIDPPDLPASYSLDVLPVETGQIQVGEIALPKSRWRERWEQRQSGRRLQHLTGDVSFAPPSRATVGDFLGLCLLIEFPDEPAVISHEQVDAFCNEVGYSEFGNSGSVFDYFLENSAGRLRYRTLVAPYYKAQRPKSYYTERTVTFAERARDLIKEALTHHKQNGLDCSGLTVDDDDGVFATNIFYTGEVVNNWSEGLWPHASRLVAPFRLASHVNAVDYQISAMGAALTLGTYCHENGHMLCDFPDLYQYSDKRRGIGKYCLMCGGGNANQRNPVHVCAYLKNLAGWGDATELTPGVRANLERGTNRFFVHRRDRGEYFIIENRQQAGRDAALPDSGLAIWHVDELGSNSTPETGPLGHRRHECALVQADGRVDLDTGINDGDSSDLFAVGASPIFSESTAPTSRWWDGTPSGLQIRAIEMVNGNISFTAEIVAQE